MGKRVSHDAPVELAWSGLAWLAHPPDSAGASSISGRNGNRCCACARGSLIIDHLDGLCIPLV